MKKQILDTNVLLRFLVGDEAKQQRQAELWFGQAREGKRKIIVVPIVIAETCFVLESFYGKKRFEVVDSLEVFVSQRWLHVEHRKELAGAWKYYVEGLHFVDSFLHSWADINNCDILSFDRKLLKKN